MFNQTQKKIELNQQFYNAVMSNDIEKIRELFSEDKNPEEMPYIDFEMETAPAIMIAAQNQHWEIVEELYNLGADLDVKLMPYKWYLVNECITNAPDRVTKAIIEESNVNVQNNKGETPLMIAIKRDKGIMADFLLETGRIDLTLMTEKQENVAHYAAQHKNYELFLKLVAKGVPLLRKNKEGKTPIDLIEDETFKLSLPVELEKIENTGGNIVLNEKSKDQENTVEDKKEIVVKKVSGLSSIKKKLN